MKNCISATCFVVDSGRVLFMKHRKLGNWMPPGGHVEANENPLQAVHRELLEEVGYKVKIIDPYPKEHKVVVSGTSDTVELPTPLSVLLEHVDYPTEKHDHFDVVYLAVIDKSQGQVAAESSDDMQWVDEKEIDGLNTYHNCKVLAHRAISIASSLSAK